MKDTRTFLLNKKRAMKLVKFHAKTIFVGISMLSASASFALNATYFTHTSLSGGGTQGCTGSFNCTQMTSPLLGIDLNDNTGYKWTVPTAGEADIYFNVASLSGTRKMRIKVNGVSGSVITISDASAPRNNNGTSFGPYRVALNAASNTVELTDTEGTAEFDVYALKVVSVAPSTLTISSPPASVYTGQNISLSASVDSSGWAYQWSVKNAPDYKKQLASSLNWNDMSYCEDSVTTPQGATTNYKVGQRFRGYVIPDTTGNYSLALASDDGAELRFSSVANATSGNVVASITNWTTPGNFNYAGEVNQQSANFYLEAGKKYYFDAAHFQGGNPDHFALGWKKPGASQYEVIPSTRLLSLDNAASTTPDGKVTREVFPYGQFTSLQGVKNSTQYLNSKSAISVTSPTLNSISFAPPKFGAYELEVKATRNSEVLVKTVRFYAQTPLANGNAESALSSSNWLIQKNNGSSAVFEKRSGCGVNNSSCLVIDAPSGDYNAGRFTQRVQLKPQTAYLFTAELRGQNIVYRDPNNKGTNNGESVVGPHINYNSGGAERVALPIGSQGWQTVSIDFATDPFGNADLGIVMGDVSGQFFIDNVQVVEIPSTELTRIESDAVVLNLYNDDIALVGGLTQARNHADKVSRYIRGLEDLSGHSRLQCHKESAWGPRKWEVPALGVSGNPIVHQPHTPYVLQNFWPTTDVIDGIFSHEFSHNFDFNPWKFGNHISRFVEVYPHDTLNTKRSEGSEAFGSSTVPTWREKEMERNETVLSKGCYSLDYFQEKILVFKDHHGWAPIKTVARSATSNNFVDWPQEEIPQNIYSQYQLWWQKLAAITGVNGWTAYHTQIERDVFVAITDSLIAGQQPLVSPRTATGTSLELGRAALLEPAQVGWGELGRNFKNKGQQLCFSQGPVAKGLYAHAPSKLRFDLGGQWTNFSGSAGVLWGSTLGTVVGVIKVDGVEKFRSSTLTATGTQAPFSINVQGGQTLELEFTEGPDSANSDWSTWINPVLTR